MIRALFLCYRCLIVGRWIIWMGSDQSDRSDELWCGFYHGFPRNWARIFTIVCLSVPCFVLFCVYFAELPRWYPTFQVALRLLFAVGGVYNFLRVKASMKLSGVMLMIWRLICRAKRSMVW